MNGSLRAKVSRTAVNGHCGSLSTEEMIAYAPGPLTDGQLRRLTALTDLLVGEDEVGFPPAAVIRRAKKNLPNLVSAEIVAKVGHGMITEDAEGVNQRLLRFFGTVN